MKKYIKIFIALLLFNSALFSQVVGLDDVITGFTMRGLVPEETGTVPLRISVGTLNDVRSFTCQFSYDPGSVFFDPYDDDLTGIVNNNMSDPDNLSAVSRDGVISISWFTANTDGADLTGQLFDLRFLYNSGFSELDFITATIKDKNGQKLSFSFSNGSIAQTTDPDVRIIFPNGGENLEVIAPPTEIRWTSVYIANVDIEYTEDDGANWEDIVTNYDAAAHSYLWTIPNAINSSDCKIRITDHATAADDESNNKFTINSTLSVALLSPDGGEVLKVGGVKIISWNHKNFENIKIEYTTNASDPTPVWNDIIASTPSIEGSYQWVIPNTTSVDCKVRISDVNTPSTVSDVSTAAFEITTAAVAVTVAEVVEANLRLMQKFLGFDYWWEESSPGWQTSFPSGHDQYFVDTLVVNGTVPVTTGWLTAVTYFEIQISYNPDILFLDEIIPSPSFPELENILFSGDDGIARISWYSQTPVDLHGKLFDMKFNYAQLDKPEDWVNDVYFSDWRDPSTPDYSAFVVGPPLTYLFVKPSPSNFSELDLRLFEFTNVQNGLIDASDWTDGSLSISNDPVVKVINPASGALLEYNDNTYTIEWESNLVDNIDISYSINGGGSYSNIVLSQPASNNSYVWTIPNVNSTTCLILIRKTGDSSIFDLSPQFTISNTSTVTVISPNGGEILKSESNKSIEWTSTNIDLVDIEYTDDDGTTWYPIAEDVDAKEYSYTWVVPDLISSDCRIRISDPASPDPDTDPGNAIFDISDATFEITNVKVQVTIPHKVDGGGDVTVPVQVDNIYDVSNIGLTINYDPGEMDFHLVESASALNGGYIGFSAESGVIRIVWITQNPVDISGDLFYIKFENYSGNFTNLTFDPVSSIKDSDNKAIDIQFNNGSVDDQPLPVGVEDDTLPQTFSLEQNYPNPFNPTTTIKFGIPQASQVNITIFNLLGQKVSTLLDEYKNPGYYEIIWDAGNIANGIYFYRIQAQSFMLTKKMILLK